MTDSNDFESITFGRIGFGRYRDLTLPQVVFRDPDWFFWAWEESKLGRQSLRAAGTFLYQRARRILPPLLDDQPVEVEYGFLKGKLASVERVLVGAPRHTGASRTVRSRCLDLCAARVQAEYDKAGGHFLVRALKLWYFDSESYRMTRVRCEAFFADDAHFLLEGD